MNRIYIIAILVIVVIAQAFFYQRLDSNFTEYKLEAQLQVAAAENKVLQAEKQVH